MRVLGVLVTSLVAFNVVYGSSETCDDVTAKLMTFGRAYMGREAPMVAAVVVSSTGVNMLSESYIEQVMCPLIESRSIDDAGEALRSSGLLRLAVDSSYSMAAVMYGLSMQSLSQSGMSDEEAIQMAPTSQRELMTAALGMVRHLDDMGYMNLNPEGYARMQGLASMIVPFGYEHDPPSVGNPQSYNTERRQEILLQDVQLLLRAAQSTAGEYWPMVAMTVNIYSGGLVDLADDENIAGLVREIAAVDSMDTLYEFISATVLMPLLNFYYPQLDYAVTSFERSLERMAELDESYVAQGHGGPGYADAAREKATTFTAFLSALRATGVLDLHW